MRLAILNRWLLLALFASAVAVVTVRQMNRVAFIDLLAHESNERDQEILWSQLLIQEGALGNPVLVLDRARRELDMVSPTTENTLELSQVRQRSAELSRAVTSVQSAGQERER